MSNRKHRSNRNDFLYMLARGAMHHQYNPQSAMHRQLIKDGLVTIERVVWRSNRGFGKAPDPRISVLRITEKGYGVLTKRRGDVRVHRDNIHMTHRRPISQRGVHREEMEAFLNHFNHEGRFSDLYEFIKWRRVRR